jgi:hypothetical protein
MALDLDTQEWMSKAPFIVANIHRQLLARKLNTVRPAPHKEQILDIARHIASNAIKGYAGFTAYVDERYLGSIYINVESLYEVQAVGKKLTYPNIRYIHHTNTGLYELVFMQCDPQLARAVERMIAHRIRNT